jgi:ABC-2 type transport system permease protein
VRADIALKTLHDLRRGFGWWSLGLAGMVALQVSVYPTVRDDSGFADLTENYPEVLQDLFGFGAEQFDYTSPAGYLGIELFSLVVPLLLIIAAVAAGAGAIAGEEDRGTLELLLSMPVGRRRVTGEKLMAMALEVVGLGLVLLISLWIGVRVIDMGVSFEHLAAAAAGAVVLAVCFGAIALLVGAATGSRGAAAGVSAALAVAAYLVNSLAALVSELEGIQKLTPFYHYEAPDPLREGFSAPHLLVLLAIAVAAGAAAVVAVERRDIGT